MEGESFDRCVADVVVHVAARIVNHPAPVLLEDRERIGSQVGGVTDQSAMAGHQESCIPQPSHQGQIVASVGEVTRIFGDMDMNRGSGSGWFRVR